MTQIVINTSYGGFGLSEAAQLRYRELAGIPVAEYLWELDRDCPHLVQTVKELGAEANAEHSRLKIVTIPDEVVWDIHEYDGAE